LTKQIRKQLRLEVPIERVILSEPLVSYGNHQVPVVLGEDMVASISVSVIRR
jgi:ribosomal protein L9